jgi:hypothetical protein
MKRLYRTICFTVFVSAILHSGDSVQIKGVDISSYLPGPDKLGAWHQVDSARIFIGEDLYTPIDGGADIYFEYGFKQVLAAEFRNNLESSIKLELYEMSGDSAAFGIFSLTSSSYGKKIQMGNEGVFNDYYLMFWKNSFLVYLTASDTASETIAEILTIASSIDIRLGAPGAKPNLLNYLPTSGLISSIYIRGKLSLSSQYIFNTKNIFEINEGIIGNYQTHRLFIFRYKSEEKTEHVYNIAHEIFKAGDRFLKFRDFGTHFTMHDQKEQTILVKRYKNIIFVIIAKNTNTLDAISINVISFLQSINMDRSN